jgi:predicted phage tail component-like protein
MISFDNLNLNDRVNYIVTHISQGRGMANRSIGLASVASREGVKILSDEYREKIIVISGIVFASDSVTFIDIMDAMKMKLAGVGKQLIIDDSDRYYVASVRNMSISDMGSEVTSADFTIEFTCEIPFALGNLHTTNYIVPSGVTTVSGLISISGTAPARPPLWPRPSATSRTPGEGTGSETRRPGSTPPTARLSESIWSRTRSSAPGTSPTCSRGSSAPWRPKP